MAHIGAYRALAEAGVPIDHVGGSSIGGVIAMQIAAGWSSTELDDREGPARRELVRQQKEWLGFLSTIAGSAVTEGHFRSKLDTEQFAHDVYGVMLAWHHARRLLHDARAEERARRAFDALVLAARPPRKPRPRAAS